MTPDTELASELRRVRDEGTVQDLVDLLGDEECDQILRALEGGWVAVAERLPEPRVRVLLANIDHPHVNTEGWLEQTLDHWDSDNWHGEQKLSAFTHWRAYPLPPMPKAVKP